MITKFLSNKWNLWGIQIVTSLMMIAILFNDLTFIDMCFVGMWVLVIGICQRILGIGKGMMVYAVDKGKLIEIVNTKYREVQQEGREVVKKEQEEKKKKEEEKRQKAKEKKQLKKNAGIKEEKDDKKTNN